MSGGNVFPTTGRSNCVTALHSASRCTPMASKLFQYDVVEKLGEGAGSVIYAVVDPSTGKRYALKHVPRINPKDIRFVQQMQDEFEISRQFNHPNLRCSYELEIHKTLLRKVTEAFLVMELVDGTQLDRRSPTDLLELVDTFIQSAQGLRTMHAMGYAHCDIKPNNILRSDKGAVKIIDYGQSCKIGTIKERIQGTPDYIAPEQVACRPISAQTDVFNLGATMYWCLTGRNIPTLYTVNRKGDNSFLMDATIETPQELVAKVPTALSHLVMECVSTQPQKRPQDMEQVVFRLELAKHVLLHPMHSHLPPGDPAERAPQPVQTQ